MDFLKGGISSKQPVWNYKDYVLSLGEWLVYGSIGILGAGAAAYVFYRSMEAFLIFFPFGAGYPLIMRRELKKRRLAQLRSQFLEALAVLTPFLSAGYPIENAFSASVGELEGLFGGDEMITREFAYMENQIHMNQTVEQVIGEFAERSGLEEVQSFAEVFGAAKRSRGQLIPIISRTTEIIREKGEVKSQIQDMTASRRMEQKIMNRMPFAIILYVEITSPGFFDIMYTTWTGRILMTCCLGIYLLSLWLSKTILDIEI